MLEKNGTENIQSFVMNVIIFISMMGMNIIEGGGNMTKTYLDGFADGKKVGMKDVAEEIFKELEREISKEADRLYKIEEGPECGEWRSKYEASMILKINALRIVRGIKKKYGVGVI
jgi:hypothetical protein